LVLYCYFNAALPSLTSYSFFIHPFSIGFGIHDALRSWIKKETNPPAGEARKSLLLKSLRLLARSLKTATGYFIYVPPYALFTSVTLR